MNRLYPILMVKLQIVVSPEIYQDVKQVQNQHRLLTIAEAGRLLLVEGLKNEGLLRLGK